MTESTPTYPASRGRLTAALRQLRAALAPLLALVVVAAFFAVVDGLWAQGTFATSDNARTMAVQTCVVAVAALGMTVIIISGGIDLSAGAALALCATVLAWGLREDLAYTLRYGGSFATLTRRLEQDQVKLRELSRETAELAERAKAKLERRILWRRGKLVAVAQQKLAHLERLDALSKHRDGLGREQDLARMQERIRRLEDTATPFKRDADWLDGIPNSPYSAPLAVALALLTGLLTGLANGALVTALRVVPFIVTLGTMTIFVGLGNLLSGNVPIRPTPDAVPAWLPALVSNRVDDRLLGAPAGVWLTLALAIGLALVLRYTVFGRHVFALGSNEATARLCGINVSATKIAIYALGGLFIGVAGIYQFSRLSTGAPSSGAGMELRVIAAVVIGGASLSGGRGTIVGTLAGAAIMAVIDSGCTQLELEKATQEIILGVIIIGAVVLDQLRQRRSYASA